MNTDKEYNYNQQPIEIPVPERAPEPANPGELPDIDVEKPTNIN